jgi:hypothetical protein
VCSAKLHIKGEIGMSSAPAFDSNLSCVFMEATLRSSYAGLGEKLPQEIWNDAVRESKVRPAFTGVGEYVKTSGSLLRNGLGGEVPVHAQAEEFSFPLHVAGFSSIAEARTFHDDLARLLDNRKVQYALREGARMSDGTTLGFQL